VIGGRVLDATAIHDLTIGRTIYGAAFLAAANDLGIALAVPAAALQDAWASAGVDDYPFLEILLGLPLTVVDPLDAAAAERSGVLARETRAAGAWDAGAAHAVLSSRDRGWPVLTADATALRAVDGAVPVELLPE
jgi:hypothetical protein